MNLSTDQNNTFVLYVWPGEWDLPSLDPECLTLMCFFKYSQVQHKVVYVDKVLELFKNDLPRLEYQNKIYVGLEEIIQCIKNEKNIDTSLTDKNYPDMIALLSLFKQKFIPAFNSLCWLDDENTYTVIRRAYGKHLKFPFSLIKLKQKEVKIHNSIMSEYKSSYVQYESIKKQIVFDAKECLNVLSVKLDENTFLFENRPTLLDAYIFGFLSILIKAPFVNSQIRNHLKLCSNLCSLLTRIQRELFPVEKKKQSNEMQKQISFLSWLKNLAFKSASKSTQPGVSTSTLEKNEEWEKRKNQIFAVSVAMTAMLVYAFAIGFIKIDVIKTDLEYVEKQ